MTEFSSKGKYEKLVVIVHVPWTMQDLVILCRCFAEGMKEIFKD